MKSTILSVLFLFIIFISNAQINNQANQNLFNDNVQFRAIAEIGFVAVAAHKIQFGQNTTYFDYVEQGGQDILFPTSRLSLEVDWKERNSLIFLYQPLSLKSEVVTFTDNQIDDILYPAGTSLNLEYNFPFYRLSYLRKLRSKSDRFTLFLGGTLQIRNAEIIFEKADGTDRKVSRNVGPVPAFKFKGNYKQSERMSFEFEVDGMYAPVSYINGSDNEVVGAILDASLRERLRITEQVDAFLNLRYLGGGAIGTSDDNTEITDGYTKNWLNLITVTTGFSFEF